MKRWIYSVICWCVAFAANAQIDCQAEFTVAPYTGQPSATGMVFTNTSTGIYEGLTWDFGDGNISNDLSSEVIHLYDDAGTYTVTLTIWGAFCAEVVSYETNIVVGDPCAAGGCVWPGDANGDGVANMYDVINIGIGWGNVGPERPDASSAWYAQPAPDWQLATDLGVDYKHLDCDGNGVINEGDLLPTTVTNFQSITETAAISEDEYPPFWLIFSQDTINVVDTGFFEIAVDVYVGNIDNPIQQLYGLAGRIVHNADFEAFIDHVEMDYNDGSFMGPSSTAALAVHQHINNVPQTDLAFTRKNGSNTNGYGKLATIKYIVVDDIFDGRSEASLPFPLQVQGAKYNNNGGGEMKDMSVQLNGVVVTVIQTTTATSNLNDDLKLKIYPNPASDYVDIRLPNTHMEMVEVYNTLGERLISQPANGSFTRILLSNLATGTYIVKVISTEGEATQKIWKQ